MHTTRARQLVTSLTYFPFRSTASIATWHLVWTLALSCCSKTPSESFPRRFWPGLGLPRPKAIVVMSRKENPQKLTQLSSRSHPRHLVGKRTAQKDITIDTTSDSQVNSNFPNRWSPASLTFNNYFYLFLYFYIT